MCGELEHAIGCGEDGSSPPAAAAFYVPASPEPCWAQHPGHIPLQSSLAVPVLPPAPAQGERRAPTPTNTPPCPPGWAQTATFLFVGRFPRLGGREMPHPGRECSSRSTNVIVSRGASMSLHLPASNPCGFCPGEPPGAAFHCKPSGGIFDSGLSTQNSSQDFQTAADTSHSHLSGCDKAHPLPEAKPTEPIDLPDHAHPISSINRFKAALPSCEPGNTGCTLLTMLAEDGRAEMNEWNTQQHPAELLA